VVKKKLPAVKRGGGGVVTRSDFYCDWLRYLYLLSWPTCFKFVRWILHSLLVQFGLSQCVEMRGG